VSSVTEKIKSLQIENQLIKAEVDEDKSKSAKIMQEKFKAEGL